MTLQEQLEHAQWCVKHYIKEGEMAAIKVAMYQQEVTRLEGLICAQPTTEQPKVVASDAPTTDWYLGTYEVKPIEPTEAAERVESADIPVAPLDSIGE